MTKKVLFLTGTRADFGKIKPLIQRVDASQLLEYAVFVTGMHTLSRYGYTVDEVYKSFEDYRLSNGFRSVFTFMNQISGESMDRILANTIIGLSRYVEEFEPDMIIVHGDRVEAMAGAIVGSLRNILVAHIEGGEISGTIDEVLRHAITKMSHIHFVANSEAANRLKQLGENPETVFVIGSPDIDLMLSPDLPSIGDVTDYYDIPFDDYGIVLFHPVTTDLESTAAAANALVSALLASQYSYVVIYPNNDQGCEIVFSAYERLENHPRFVIYPSLRIEFFLTLLKNSAFIIGNSSAGVREAPVYGVYSINIGERQKNRFQYRTLVNVHEAEKDISKAIGSIAKLPICEPSFHFGDGDSSRRFVEVLENPKLWAISKQKQFVDIDFEPILKND